MKKIINPWKDMEGYNCFGCSPDNEAGVRMEFYEDGDEVVSIEAASGVSRVAEYVAWRHPVRIAG